MKFKLCTGVSAFNPRYYSREDATQRELSLKDRFPSYRVSLEVEKDTRYHSEPDKLPYNEIIEIDTLEELLAFQKSSGYELIIDEDSIEIYDGYRE
jgi:hypothetical protein